MQNFLDSLRHVFRRLLRSPVFTAITLLTLTIGIGANTAIFSVLEGVLLRPLPYPHPDELIGVWHTAPGIGMKELNSSPSCYFTYRSENRTLQDIGLYTTDSVTITGLAQPEQVPALDFTDGVLPLLGVRPALGRGFSRFDDAPKSPATAILGYAYWKARFGGSPSAIGRRIVVDGKAHEIIGVLPADFRFLDNNPSLILPFQFDPAETKLGNFSFESVARLKPGVTLAQASADIARMLPIINARFPAPPGFSVKMFEDARIGPNLRPFKQDLVGDIGTLLWVLMGAIGIVLLVACANVANLLLVRADGRQQELAVRAALGAGRFELARELLIESVLLGLVGGGLGLFAAYGALRRLVFLGPNLPRLSEVSIDPEVLFFTLAVSLFAGLLFGLVPVVKYTGPNLATALRGGGRTQSQSRERHRARGILVVVQVSLAVVLLIGSGLMIRTFQALKHVNPGFTGPEQLQTFRLFIPESQVADPLRVVRMQQDILDRLRAIPGVSAAALGDIAPMESRGEHDPVFAEDHTYAEGRLPPIRRFSIVSPGWFATMGTPLAAGRDFTWNDLANGAPIAMVSENMARELWGAPSAALGKRIRPSLSDPWREVVGVAADVHNDGFDQAAPATAYWPMLMKNFEASAVSTRRTAVFVVRSPSAGSAAFLGQVRRAVWSVNPNLPLFDVRTAGDLCRRSLARTSFTLVMLAIAGVMALVLGVIGVYGVLSYSVSQRTREVGIRSALGARRRELVFLFVRHGLVLALAGVAFGLTAAVALTRWMSTLLFHVDPFDPITYSVAAGALAAAAAVASFIPALRAASIDPVQALRAE